MTTILILNWSVKQLSLRTLHSRGGQFKYLARRNTLDDACNLDFVPKLFMHRNNIVCHIAKVSLESDFTFLKVYDVKVSQVSMLTSLVLLYLEQHGGAQSLSPCILRNSNTHRRAHSNPTLRGR